MSYCKQTELSIGSFLADQVYGAAVIAALNDSRAVPSGEALATLARVAPEPSRYGSVASLDSALSKGGVLLLQEKQALSKAIEELRLRRRAVVAARLRVEDEVNRRAVEENAHRREEIEARARLQENAGRLTVLTPKRLGESGGGRQDLRLVEPQVKRSKAGEQAPEGLTLRQRLRAEIDAVAAAQRKRIDASLAQLNVLRKAQIAHATTAA